MLRSFPGSGSPFWRGRVSQRRQGVDGRSGSFVLDALAVVSHPEGILNHIEKAEATPGQPRMGNSRSSGTGTGLLGALATGRRLGLRGLVFWEDVESEYELCRHAVDDPYDWRAVGRTTPRQAPGRHRRLPFSGLEWHTGLQERRSAPEIPVFLSWFPCASWLCWPPRIY